MGWLPLTLIGALVYPVVRARRIFCLEERLSLCVAVGQGGGKMPLSLGELVLFIIGLGLQILLSGAFEGWRRRVGFWCAPGFPSPGWVSTIVALHARYSLRLADLRMLRGC